MNGRDFENALNELIRSLRVVSVQRHFCSTTPEPGWAVCVEYVDARAASGRSKDDDDKRVDYREILDPETFKVFSLLRGWRKEIADKESVPVYTILSNEQLAEVARKRCSNLKDLEAIDGIGAAKIKKYGADVIAKLKENSDTAPKKPSPPEATK